MNICFQQILYLKSMCVTDIVKHSFAVKKWEAFKNHFRQHNEYNLTFTIISSQKQEVWKSFLPTILKDFHSLSVKKEISLKISQTLHLDIFYWENDQ